MGKETKVSYLFSCLGLIEYLKRQWINAKIYNTMKDVDKQVEEIKKDWDGFTQPTPKIIETPSEVKGLNDMSISFSSEEEDPSSARYSFVLTSKRVSFFTSLPNFSAESSIFL